MNTIAPMRNRDRVAAYASRPQAELALFSIAALEGVFIPVSADDLIIPMGLLSPDRAFRYAMIATAGSVCGALVGFIIGLLAFRALGLDLFGQYGMLSSFLFLQGLFVGYVGIIVVSAGFSTIPYKIVTFFAGFFGAALPAFMMASIVSRGARYFLMAWLIWRGGTRYSQWLERNFYGVSLVITLGCLILFAMAIFVLKTS